MVPFAFVLFYIAIHAEVRRIDKRIDAVIALLASFRDQGA